LNIILLFLAADLEGMMKSNLVQGAERDFFPGSTSKKVILKQKQYHDRSHRHSFLDRNSDLLRCANRPADLGIPAAEKGKRLGD